MSALAAARARVVGLLRKESIVAAMPRPEHESVSVLYSVWAGLGQRRIGTRQEIEKNATKSSTGNVSCQHAGWFWGCYYTNGVLD